MPRLDRCPTSVDSLFCTHKSEVPYVEKGFDGPREDNGKLEIESKFNFHLLKGRLLSVNVFNLVLFIIIYYLPL